MLNAAKDLARIDRRLLSTVMRSRSARMNRVMTSASLLANRSKLWVAVAACLALAGRRPRTAAASGLLGLGIASALVNGPLKVVWRRTRPALPLGPGRATLVPLPRTFSFPSGHAASAAAFATGTSIAMPAAAPVVVPMAATVGYSRVYVGVHYPSDVVVGATVGAAAGGLAAWAVRRLSGPLLWELDAPTCDVPVPRTAMVLAGTRAGGAGALDEALRVIKERGFVVAEVIPVEEAERVSQRLRADGAASLVIAAGGDGTVSAAANAIADTDAVLAILPLGTSNDVARSLGLPTDPVEAAELIGRGRVVSVDSGRVAAHGYGSRVFLNAATVGLNAAFARVATHPSVRDRFGRFTYVIAALRALRDHAPFDCTLEYDGVRHSVQAVQVTISNAPAFGGVLDMRVPGSSMTDGLLDVIVVERLTRPRRAFAGGRAAVGRPKPVRGVHTAKVRSIRISAHNHHDITVDGELFGQLPAVLEVRTASIQVVAPQPASRDGSATPQRAPAALQPASRTGRP